MPRQAPSPLCGYWHPNLGREGPLGWGRDGCNPPAPCQALCTPMSGTIYLDSAGESTTSRSGTGNPPPSSCVPGPQWPLRPSWPWWLTVTHGPPQNLLVKPLLITTLPKSGWPKPFAQLGKHPRDTDSYGKLLPWWQCCTTCPGCQAWWSIHWPVLEANRNMRFTWWVPFPAECRQRLWLFLHILTPSTQISTREKVIQPPFWDGCRNPALPISCRFPAGCVLPP